MPAITRIPPYRLILLPVDDGDTAPLDRVTAAVIDDAPCPVLLVPSSGNGPR